MSEILSLPIVAEMQSFALRVALCGAAIGAAVLLAARLLQRRSEPLRYGVLFCGVVGLLAVPPLVGVTQSVVTVWQPWLAPAGEEVITVDAALLPALLDQAPVEPAIDAASAPAAAPALLVPVIAALLFAVWCLGAAFGLCRLAYALWKLRRVLLGRPWRPAFWTQERQVELAQKLGLKRFPAVYCSSAAPMPMVVGILRPAIVVPEQAPAAWQQAQWEAVLLHEAAHVARRDPWAGLLQRVAVIFYWWCPFVHVINRQLGELRENICDDCALEGPCDHLSYAELLVESAERFLKLKTVPVPLGLLNSARGGLEARISRLLHKERRPMTKLSWPGKLLGGGILAAACLLTAGSAALSQPPAPRKVQIKIVVDGKEIELGEAQIADILQAAPAGTAPKTVEYRVVKVQDPNTIPAARLPAEVGLQDRIVAVQVAPAPTTAPPKQPDPRIEELVKQAEAIKPGAGAAVRRALQEGTPAADVLRYGVPARVPLASPPAGAVPQPERVPMVRAPVTPLYQPTTGAYVPGQKIVILAVEDGKVRQLNDQEIRIILEKGVQSRVTDPKAANIAGARVVHPGVAPAPLFKPDPLPKTSAVRNVPLTTPGADLDALRRQLERISAELSDLRKRLDSGAK